MQAKRVMWRLTGTLRWSATSARRQSTEKAEAAMAGDQSDGGEGNRRQEGLGEYPKRDPRSTEML